MNTAEEKIEEQKTVYLKDYKPPNYWIDSADLHFDLHRDHTIVRASLQCRRNKEFANEKTPLVLNGEKLELIALKLNGQVLNKPHYTLDEDTLTLPHVPDTFTLETAVKIYPEKNTTLMGLYRSSVMFCTQCEAEGFRRVTFYTDRPDVLSKFTTTIEADKKEYPVLLSNGNCIESGELKGGRHFVKWQDPFKKPCYLFALVAGDLVGIEDHFVSMSGRLITLKFYVERENQDKCQHAIEALKQAMKWDEETYGREYDLDIYMVVAVNDFNVGAMENKGLNIFNTKYVLARPESASDGDFLGITSVIGHEYFHNWSGNRVTCRDWFQLSLKEGLTVFRDQHFTRDITGSAVSLIDQAAGLRGRQFIEDSGPLSHPVQPQAYQEIDNFYTATIYEKGAEVIRMMKTLLGWDNFRKGMDIYFSEQDGHAATIEDFVAAMEKASGVSLAQFKLWYSQAGTPEIEVKEEYDEKAQIYALTLKQYCPSTPNQPEKKPMHIPIAVGLLGKEGKDLLKETQILSLVEPSQRFTFNGIKEKPIPSILRNFSAPVKVKTDLSNEALAFLLAHDSDEFNRWESGQKLSERMILSLIETNKLSKALVLDELWLKSHQAVLRSPHLNPALKVEILSLPSTGHLIELMTPADTDILYTVKQFILKEMANQWESDWKSSYDTNVTKGQYQYTTELADKRSLKNLCLHMLLKTEKQDYINLCVEQWRYANNMTDAFSAVSALSDLDCPERETLLSEFYEKWKHDPLVVNKWLRLQAYSALPNTFEKVSALTKHPAFDLKNPNKVYSLIGAFSAGNLVRFHDKSGRPYEWFASLLLELDALNPKVASRMMGAFEQWKRFEPVRKEKMQKALKRIQSHSTLSKEVREIVDKCLA